MNNKFLLTIHSAADSKQITNSRKTVYLFPVGATAEAVLERSEALIQAAPDTAVFEELAKEPASVTITTAQSPLQQVSWQSVDAEKKFTPAYFRNFVAGQVKNFSTKFYSTLVIVVPEFSTFQKHFASKEYYYQTFIEGAYYGNYTYNAYKSDAEEPKPLDVVFVTGDNGAFESLLAPVQKYMSAIELTRNLQNEPASDLYPETFATRIREQFSDTPIAVEVLDEAQILERKMGGLHGVGKGSDHGPRFVVLSYKPEKSVKHVALVGKGVTFDTGGISIKPAADMGEMKGDMSGAAVVAGAVYAAALLQLPLQITGIMPLAENMPSGKSMRPGDILTTSSGKTIEVDNTDAEGRLILADALHYAKELQPDAILDFATLTGACVVALGEFVAGLFTSHDALAQALFTAGMETDERVWRMPMWDEYNQLIKSDVADVKNIGGRWGGAITAAKFLENWAGKDIPWAHIDIAGPSAPHKYNPYTDTYFTGFGVRLTLRYLQAII